MSIAMNYNERYEISLFRYGSEEINLREFLDALTSGSYKVEKEEGIWKYDGDTKVIPVEYHLVNIDD